MTLKKLLSILQDISYLYSDDINMHGSCISATGGGELELIFNTQPSKSMHNYLKRRGFIYLETRYIYRPR